MLKKKIFTITLITVLSEFKIYMSANKKTSISLFLLCIMMMLASCRTSSVSVFDADTGHPIPDALVFAYCQEILTLGPRQELIATNVEGTAKTIVKPSGYIWAGKQGYYPFYCRPRYKGSIFSISGETFIPEKIYLHKVKDGSFEEAMKARNHAGIIFYHNNPPRKKDLLKILQYSHWVYMNTAFYDANSYRKTLEEFFKKYSFKTKP